MKSESPAASSRENQQSRGAARSPTFDPEAFLEKAGVGRTLVELKKNQVLFSQGDEADAVFYLQKGNLKLTVVSQRGKEATVALLRPATSSARPASPRRSASAR